jgi:hypothetical protein
MTTTVTRYCAYCNEPFTPKPGPMEAKQRFCCTRHRVYANRDGKRPEREHVEQEAKTEAAPINWDSMPLTARKKRELKRH